MYILSRCFRAALVGAMLAGSGASLAAYDITQSVIAGGGASSSGGAYALIGTIGQSLTSTSSGGSYVVNSGFWAGGSAGALLTFDVDLNGSVTPMTDGLLILRHMFGFTGTALTGGAIGTGATLTSPAQITQRLGDIASILDIDQNNSVDALTDGVLLLRYLSGLRGTALTVGAIGPGAQRSTYLTIEPYIQSLLPAP